MRRRVALAVVAIATAISIYGLIHERLLDQPIWYSTGVARFAMYAAAFWAVALAFVILRPTWLAPGMGLIVAGYTAWRCGVMAPFAVLYLLGSCFLLGKILARRSAGATSLLIGVAAWLFAISIAVHFPINTRVVYWVAFAIPYVIAAARAFSAQSDSQKGIFFLRLGFIESKIQFTPNSRLLICFSFLVRLAGSVSCCGLPQCFSVLSGRGRSAGNSSRAGAPRNCSFQ